jgi:hypothetical protein
MQTQNQTQQFAESEQFVLPLSEDELEEVAGGAPPPMPIPFPKPHLSCKVDAGELSAWAAGGATAGKGLRGKVQGAVGGFVGSFLSQLHNC